MKRRFPALVLALVSVLLLAVPCPPAARASQGEDYIEANHTAGNGRPYYIMVNRAQCTVTVYELGANGYYSVPVKAMVCSIGREGHETPLGTWPLGWKSAWTYMVDGSYGQYSSCIVGGILFHSVCYYRKDPSSLMTHEYNGLGAPASLGCVRLQVADAKWIFDNCAQGTLVTIYDGTDPGPLGKPDRLVDGIDPDHSACGWDPTDPREENPWNAILLSRNAGGEDYGEPLAWAVEKGITRDGVFDPGAACTRVQAMTMLWRASGGPASAARLPRAVDETEAYAAALRWAVEKGMIDGSFLSDAPCARADAVKYIWRAFGSPETGAGTGFADVRAGTSYAAAVAWARENGIADGGPSAFSPYERCTQAQFLWFLYRAYN